MSFQRANTILKIDNVSLNLGGKQILKGVNAEVKDIIRPGVTQGQIVGFLGPSGIGKTKLFEILSGLLQPTEGQVLIGDPLAPVKVGKVGVVQQNFPLFNHRTVMGNLEIAASKGDVPKDQQKAKILELLDQFGLRSHANHYPAELSGGQRQRIAIAQQLLCSGTFLLLDEPFSGLDIIMIEKVCAMIQLIATTHEHTTIIIVSHDIDSTAAIADTLWLMGRDFAEDGTPIPGSRIKHLFDLAEMGLCWQPEIHKNPKFVELVQQVKEMFKTL